MNQNYPVPVTFKIQGLNELKAANEQMKRMGGGSGTVAKATRSTAKFGSTAQNASYQVQDFIVQVQGGTDPMRAMSQQLPQMVVGMGAWGAAIGLAAAALPALIVAMSDAEDEATDLDDALSTLDGSLGKLTDVSSGLSFNAWNEAWNEAGQSVRAARLELLKFNITASESALNESLRAMTTELEGAATGMQGFMGGLHDFLLGVEGGAETLADIDMAESLGIDRATVDQLQAINAEYKTGEITLEQMKNEMVALGAATQGANQAFYEHVRNVVRLAEAEAELVQARKQAGAAGISLGSGGDLPTDPKSGRKNNQLTGAAANFAINLREILDAFGESDNNVLVEQISLAEQAVQSFEQSFDSAVTGIAMGTQDIKSAFQSMVQSVVAQMGKLLAEWLTNIAVQSLFGGSGVTANAKGNVIDGGQVTAFAKGGVVTGPTVFPMAKGMGLMGEAGPEAVMPLARNSRGELGVKGGGVTIINNAPGVELIERETDSGPSIEVVLSAVAAQILRGGGSVSSALEQSYGLGRGRALR